MAVFNGDLRGDYSHGINFKAMMECGMTLKQWLYAKGHEPLKIQENDVKRLFEYADLTEQVELMLHCFKGQPFNGLNLIITDKEQNPWRLTVTKTVLIPNFERRFLLCQVYLDSSQHVGESSRLY